MESRERIGFVAIGTIGLALALGGFMLHRPGSHASFVKADMTAAATPAAPPAAVVQTPKTNESCLRTGIGVTLSQAIFHISGPPALTVVMGEGVDDEINFATKAGVDKGCLSPSVTAKAIALNFDAMDKDWGVSANWRAAFCGQAMDDATRFLCSGEDRPKGSPRRLALVAIYDPKTFDGESMFRQDAPVFANFQAWKDQLTKANTPPPVQADGPFDIYPGGIWVERDGKGGDPFLVSCDVDSWPVGGQHYCIGTLSLDKGLRARVEFRTATSQIGSEATAAEDHLRALLSTWQAP
jgi:hypothetical protein